MVPCEHLQFSPHFFTGIAEEEELHQYVIYETDKPQRRPPRRINLDDPDPRKGKIKEPDIGRYLPPTSLTVHLSKIDMPELRPKANPSARRRSSGSNAPIGRAPSPQYSFPPPPPPISVSVPVPMPMPMPMPMKELPEKERKRIEKESRKIEKESRRKDKDKARRDSYFPQPSLAPPPSTNKLSKPSPSPSPRPHPHPPYHTPAHMSHPYQPSPSPAQLGNPAIYAAPPPPTPTPPQQQHRRQSSSIPRPGSMAFPQPQPPSAVFSQLESQDGLGYQTAYVVPGPSGSGGGGAGRGFGWGGGGRPTSIYGGSGAGGGNGSGKGPVSTLLHMWSKD